MILIQRIITFLSPLLIAVAFELAIYQTIKLSIAGALTLLIVFLSVFKLSGAKFISKELWGFLISPVFLIGSTTLFILILEGKMWQHAALIICILIYTLYLEHIFKFIHQSPRYQPYSLENTSNYANIISVFFLFSSAFGLKMFLGYKTWQLIVPILVSLLLLSIQMFWVNKIHLQKRKIILPLILLIMAEGFWAVHFLPTDHYANALILTVVFYVIIDCSRLYFTNALTAKTIKRHAFLGFLALILTLTSSRWS